MEFDRDSFEIEILNDHRIVRNMGEMVDAGIDFL